MPIMTAGERAIWAAEFVRMRAELDAHKPPAHVVLDPGTWEWKCQTCGEVTIVCVHDTGNWATSGNMTSDARNRLGCMTAA